MVPGSLRLRCILAGIVGFAIAGCSRGEPRGGSGGTPDAEVARVAPDASLERPDSGGDAADSDAQADAAPVDARPLHFTTQADLIALIDVVRPKKRRADFDPDELLAKAVGPDGPSRVNQGNPALAHHDVSRAKCLESLKDMTLQTDAQREQCGGRENMVPIFKKGQADKAKTCIDVFEFPNKACELPMVWAPPAWAARLCEVEGKRLCTQEEWVLACSGDPEGGEPSKYSYGNELDLEICNTHKSASATGCDADSAGSAWKTCETNTEPSGSFPRCRSRFGVFDMQGNVAEEMTRLDFDGHIYSQLKGSAFFYVDVARKPGIAPTKQNYADHCGHDPRWHVELMTEAWHVNYHLGFRCCAQVR